MITATTRGLPDLAAALRDVSTQLRRRILRNALAKAGRVVRDDARKRAPVLRSSTVINRTPGLLRKSIAVRTSKQAAQRGDVGVYITVKRPTGAKYIVTRTRGARGTTYSRKLKAASKRNQMNDPFYWRFVEAGTKKMRARGFLRAAAGTLGQALQVFIADVGPQVQRLNNRVRPIR